VVVYFEFSDCAKEALCYTRLSRLRPVTYSTDQFESYNCKLVIPTSNEEKKFMLLVIVSKEILGYDRTIYAAWT